MFNCRESSLGSQSNAGAKYATWCWRCLFSSGSAAGTALVIFATVGAWKSMRTSEDYVDRLVDGRCKLVSSNFTELEEECWQDDTCFLHCDDTYYRRVRCLVQLQVSRSGSKLDMPKETLLTWELKDEACHRIFIEENSPSVRRLAWARESVVHHHAAARRLDDGRRRRSLAVGPKSSPKFGSCTALITEHVELEGFDCSFGLVHKKNHGLQGSVDEQGVYATKSHDHMGVSTYPIMLFVTGTICSSFCFCGFCWVLCGCPTACCDRGDVDSYGAGSDC